MLLTSSLSEFFEMCQFKIKANPEYPFTKLRAPSSLFLPSALLVNWKTDHMEERGK